MPVCFDGKLLTLSDIFATQRRSPVSNILARLDISERRLQGILPKDFENKSVLSLSSLSRQLKEPETLDTDVVETIGRQIAGWLKVSDEDSGRALLAAHWIWRNEMHGLDSTAESLDIRAPVVRLKLFREAVQTILYDKSVFVFSVAAANEKQVGRSAFALSLAQYCAYDAPPSARRTLRVASLAQLDSKNQTSRPLDIDRIAGLISAQFPMAQRSGRDIIGDLATYFRYLPRPLLLIKDAHGVPHDLLVAFVTQLYARLPQDSDFVLLIASDRPVLGNPYGKAVYLDYMTPEETGAFIVWKTAADHAELPELNQLCAELKEEIRKPSVASLLAGAYLLAELSHAAPWDYFPISNNNFTAPDSLKEKSVAKTIRQFVESSGGAFVCQILSRR